MRTGVLLTNSIENDIKSVMIFFFLFVLMKLDKIISSRVKIPENRMNASDAHMGVPLVESLM